MEKCSWEGFLFVLFGSDLQVVHIPSTNIVFHSNSTTWSNPRASCAQKEEEMGFDIQQSLLKMTYILIEVMGKTNVKPKINFYLIYDILKKYILF